MEQELLELSPALIVEDDPATRLRLARLLTGLDAAADITAVGSLAEAYQALARKQFAIALVDIGLPDGDGRELVARLHRQCESMPVLVISSWGHEDTVLAALRAGAIGYLLKEREDVELAFSLKSIQRGGAPIDPVIARRILTLLPGPDAAAPPAAEEVRLSTRELEVLQLLARGCSNREIAELVSLSRLTVEGYIKAIYRKLAVGSRTAAVFEAQKLGLLR
ncbi:response regulator transcription factor [Lysobacter tyrosinilyticus]